MLRALQTFSTLRWTQQPQYRPLPSHTERKFVQTPNGPLELLACEPRQPSENGMCPAMFFVHGGYGCASVWLEWMTYLYEQDYPGRLYAYSAIFDIAEDLAACVNHAQELNAGHSMALVARSAGGGLIQYALAKGLVRARGLCLVDAVPHFGMADLYWTWFKHDPWFLLRSVLHLGHPSSPLSTPSLVQGAFFGIKFNSRDVSGFMQWMPCYESMRWPIGQFGSFWQWLRGRNTWSEVKDILRHVEVSRAKSDKDIICVIVGLEDMMYDEGMLKRVAKEYGDCIYDLESSKKIDRRTRGSAEDAKLDSGSHGIIAERQGGVRVARVGTQGIMSRTTCRVPTAARALWEFVIQVP